MTGKHFFQISLSVPLVLPFIGVAIGRHFEDIGALISTFLIFSLALGGLPYVLFATGVLFWSKDKTQKQLRRLSYYAPLVFSAVALVLIFVITVVSWDFSFLAIFPVFFAYTVILGYLYVGIVNVIYEISYDEEEP